jgi:endonuclease YncB( thermonuclease family)
MISRIFFIALIAFTQPAFADKWIQGSVTHVRDADTIEVNGMPIRFNGVDAPELKLRSGRAGKKWMQGLILRKPVKCSLTGEKTYDRWVGTCYASSGEDLSALVIAAGHARDCPRYSNGKYSSYETKASRKHKQSAYCR